MVSIPSPSSNFTPSRWSARTSSGNGSRSCRYGAIANLASPPGSTCSSYTVTSNPRAASSPAQTRPAGPAPMTATGYQFRGRRRRRGVPPSSATSVAKRCNRPISIGFRPSCRSTHAPSQSISTGQTRAQVPPSRFSAKIVAAAASASSRAIAATKPGTSTPAGHAVTHGASAYGPPHSRHLSASTTASGLVNGETSSSKTCSGCGATVAITTSLVPGPPTHIGGPTDAYPWKGATFAQGAARPHRGLPASR